MVTIGVAIVAGLVACSVMFLALCAGSQQSVLQASAQHVEPPSDLDRMDGVGDPLTGTPQGVGRTHFPQRIA